MGVGHAVVWFNSFKPPRGVGLRFWHDGNLIISAKKEDLMHCDMVSTLLVRIAILFLTAAYVYLHVYTE